MSALEDLIRESSRDTAGRFGPRPHSAPEVTIDANEPHPVRTWGEWEELAEKENQRRATEDVLHGDGFQRQPVTAARLRQSAEYKRRWTQHTERVQAESE